MSKVISVVNNKGGVGKTTTVFNLAAALAMNNRKVLMVDLDPQGSLTTYLGFDPLKMETTISNVFTNEVEMDSAIYKTDKENLDFIASNIELSAVEVGMLSADDRQSILRNRVHKIADLYDYIIIDNSPSLGLLTINSMIASDYVIAPVDPTYLSLRGLEILISTIEEVKTLNEKLVLMGVLITMYDGRTIHNNEVVDLLNERYPVFTPIIKRSIKFPDACLSAKSIMEFAGPKFDGSAAYMELAKEVMTNA